MTTSEDKIRALEIKIEELMVRNLDLRRSLENGREMTERMARALAFVIGWVLHHHHHDEIRIPNVDLVEERDCYEFEQFPDVATAETIYRTVYHDENRVKIPDQKPVGYTASAESGTIKTDYEKPPSPTENLILDPVTGKPFKFGGDAN